MTNPKTKNNAHPPGNPPGQGKSKAARRRRNRKAKMGAGAQRPRMIRKKGSTIQVFDESNLNLPRNEADRFSTIVAAEKNDQVAKYLACLINPKQNISRIPDSFPRPTAVVRSILDFGIPVRYDSTDPDPGRFSMAVQPFLGSTDRVARFKVGVTSGTAPGSLQWNNNDFSSSNVYATALNGLDVRVDPYMTTLTQNPPGIYQIFNSTANGSTTPKAFKDALVFPSIYPEDSNTSFVHDTNPGVSLVTTAAGAANQFRIAPGQYLFMYEATTADTFTAGGPNLALVSGVAADFIKDINHAVRSPDNKMEMLSVMLTVKSPVVVQLDVPLTTAGATYQNSIARFTPTYYSSADQGGVIPFAINAGSVPAQDFGMIQQYRPVAMTVLVTYMGTTLLNGGTISGAYVPGGTLENCYYTAQANSLFGQLQNWENLARVPGAYNGRLEKGIFCRWMFEDYEDLEFKPPSGTLGHKYPSIVVSGQIQPGNSTATQTFGGIIRAEIVTVYEITTESNLLSQERLVGSQDTMDRVNRALKDQPFAMENATHGSWVKDFWGGFKQGLGIFKKGFDTVLPIISAL